MTFLSISANFIFCYEKKRLTIQNKHTGGGTLYLVSTPIGNLEDITLRAIRILEESGFILAEDTRTARRLLNHLGFAKKIISYYSYNEQKRIPYVLNELQTGQQIALISEAGTPLISDPGHKLVAAAIREDIPVVPVPGPSAVLAALVASGLPTDRFVFEGFLPRKKGRKTRMEKLAGEPGTVIIYESVPRLQKTIEDIVKIWGNRYIVIARELTKKFEEFSRGFAEDIAREVASRRLKGELVLLVSGTDYKPDLTQKTEI